MQLRNRLAVLAPFAVVGASAHAALPSGTDTAIAAILTDATTLAGYVAPVMLGILGFTIAFKLIKRFASKV